MADLSANNITAQPQQGHDPRVDQQVGYIRATFENVREIISEQQPVHTFGSFCTSLPKSNQSLPIIPKVINLKAVSVRIAQYTGESERS